MDATDADELAAACARLDRALTRLDKAEAAYRAGLIAVRDRAGYGATAAIARHLGVHRVTINKLIRGHGGDLVDQSAGRAVRGLTDNDKAELTRLFDEYAAADDDVNGKTDGAYAHRSATLRKLHGSGRVGVAELARAIGQSETTVGDIVNAAHRGAGRSRTARRRTTTPS